MSKEIDYFSAFGLQAPKSDASGSGGDALTGGKERELAESVDKKAEKAGTGKRSSDGGKEQEVADPWRMTKLRKL